MRKFISMFLAVAVLLSLFASAGTVSYAEDTAQREYAEDEWVKLTVLNAGPDLNGVFESAVTTEIAKKTGVQIVNVVVDDDKFPVILAAGDLPELVYCNGSNSQSASSLIASGQIIPLDELVENNCPNIVKWCKDAIPYSKTVLSDETGTLYYIPTNVGNNEGQEKLASYYGGGIVYFMRWDMYKAAGYPEITDEDSYLQVLKEIQDMFPETEDGKKVYAIGAFTNWNTWAWRIPYTFASGYGEGKNATLYDYMVGDPVPEYYADEYWNIVRFYNKAYNMGILDPESFTQTNEDYLAKASAGQYISVGLYWGDIQQINLNLQAINPNYGFLYVPGSFEYLQGLYDDPSVYGWGQGNFSFAISTNNTHIEETLRLLDFLYTPEGCRILACGVEGEDWEYTEEGKIRRTQQYMDGVSADPANYAKNRGINVYNLMHGLALQQILDDGTPIDLRYTVDNMVAEMLPFEQDYCNYYADLYQTEILYPGMAVAQLLKLEGTKYKFRDTYTDLINDMTSNVSEDAGSILSEIDTMLGTDYVTLIMTPTEEIEAAIKAEIEKIDGIGYADIVGEIEEATAKAKTIAQEIVK